MERLVGGVEVFHVCRHRIGVGSLCLCGNQGQQRSRAKGRAHQRAFNRSRISRSSTTSSGGGGGVASAGSGLVCNRLIPRISTNKASATTAKLMTVFRNSP